MMSGQRRDGTVDVLLCNMPFGLVVTPSLALGLLQASLGELAVRSLQRHFCLGFAKSLGFSAYQGIANRRGSSHQEIGDWVFAQALFFDREMDTQGYIDNILNRPDPELELFLAKVREEQLSEVLDARNLAEPFLGSCLDEIKRCRPKIVGFTCMFQQRVASLALARRIKEHWPHTFIVFGGAECEGERGCGIVRSFPFVDASVSGAGDIVFPEIVKRVLEGRSVEGIPGVHTRADDNDTPLADAPDPIRLDDLPFPQFEDYFEELAAITLQLSRPVYLSLETSRGCWWGQKHQCTFCGINGADLSYLSKSGQRVIDEISHYAKKYPGAQLIMTDSILDPKYFTDVFPKLASIALALDIQYEVRATLRRDQLKLLRRCGVAAIQPGIESLSTLVLKLICKGTDALCNVRLLKWCKELGITVYWNLLYGFPEEPTVAYDDMAKLIPKLSHLDPPEIRFVQICRHSPLFDHAEKLGITNIQPSPAYHYIYALPDEEIRALASYFTFEYRRPRDVIWYTADAISEIGKWQACRNESELYVVHEPERSLVLDERPGFGMQAHIFSGLEHELLVACDDIRRIEDLIDTYGSTSRVEDAMATLEQHGLVALDGGNCLGLAVIAPPVQEAVIRHRILMDL